MRDEPPEGDHELVPSCGYSRRFPAARAAAQRRFMRSEIAARCAADNLRRRFLLAGYSVTRAYRAGETGDSS